MSLLLSLECADAIVLSCDARALQTAAAAALTAAGRTFDDIVIEIDVRIVDEAESAALNGRYRDKPYATNVLSFPAGAELPGLSVLGDLAICLPVVEREAHAQHKTLDAHLSHMIVHGVLHLLGFDHIGDDEAGIMEMLERRVMAELGHADPYREAAGPVAGL